MLGVSGIDRDGQELKAAHLDLTGVSCSVGDGESSDLDIASQGGSFFEREETAAGEITGDQTVDQAFIHLNGAMKFDFCAFFDKETVTNHFAGDFAMSAKNEVAGAFDISGEVSLDGQLVTLNGASEDDAFFVNMNVSPGLNAAVVSLFDLAILHRNQATATSALG